MAKPGTFTGELQRGWQRFWGLSWKWKGPIIAVVALIVIGAIGSAGGSGDSKNAKTPAAIEAVKAVETATLKPTDTPKPTNTPKAPTATPTPSDANYRLAVVAFSTALSSNLGSLTDLLTNPAPTSAKWRADITAAADEIIDTATKLRDVPSPSDAWKPFKAAITKPLDTYIQAMTLLKSGVNNLSVSAIDDAAAMMAGANSQITAAIALIPKQ